MEVEMRVEPSATPLRPDWRDANSKKPLLKRDRAGWAWEWLRRNPDYIAQAARVSVQGTSDGKTRPVTIPATKDVAGWGLLLCRDARPPGE
jgi:hypothetical protein